MSCLESDKCEKYQGNIGNPYPNESPCNHCNKNISDFKIGYLKGQKSAYAECIEALRELGCAENGDEIMTLQELKEQNNE